MLDLKCVEREIAELRSGDAMSSSKCHDLAMLYVIRWGMSQVATGNAGDVSYESCPRSDLGGSWGYVEGCPPTKALRVFEETLEELKVTHPGEYARVMKKLKED